MNTILNKFHLAESKPKKRKHDNNKEQENGNEFKVKFEKSNKLKPAKFFRLSKKVNNKSK